MVCAYSLTLNYQASTYTLTLVGYLASFPPPHLPRAKGLSLIGLNYLEHNIPSLRGWSALSSQDLSCCLWPVSFPRGRQSWLCSRDQHAPCTLFQHGVYFWPFECNPCPSEVDPHHERCVSSVWLAQVEYRVDEANSYHSAHIYSVNSITIINIITNMLYHHFIPIDFT